LIISGGAIMKKYYCYLFLTITLIFCFQLCGISQEKMGSIEGVVVDAIGDPLPEAKLVLKAKEPEAKEGTCTTNEKGEFKFADLAPGEYELTCSAEAFTTNKYTGLPVIAGKILKINVKLLLPLFGDTMDYKYEKDVEWAEYLDKPAESEEKKPNSP
jgi:hypothetical protein